MLKVDENKDLEMLKQYGFNSYKVNRNQTNYYRCFAYNSKLIIINNINKEVFIDKWYDDDNRIHKVPKCSYKDKTPLSDVMYDLIMDGIVVKQVEVK